MDPPDEPDPARTRALLERALGGDGQAERRLFESLRRILHDQARRHRLMKLVARTATEDDVVGEVWLRFYSAGSFAAFEDRGPGSLRRFLGIVLDRTMVDMVRRARAHKRTGDGRHVPLEETGPGTDAPRERCGLVSKDPTPTSRARESEMAELCRRELDEREGEVWRQVEIEGCSSVEVAARLGLTPAAVRGVLFRARAKLIRALEKRNRPGSP